MQSIRKALLSIVASAALLGAATAFARNMPPSEPGTAADAVTPASYLPPMYFGPTYSAAAVYGYIRPKEVPPRARIGTGRRAIAVARRTMRP